MSVHVPCSTSQPAAACLLVEGGHGEAVEVGEQGHALAVERRVVEGHLHHAVVLLAPAAHAAHHAVRQPAPLAVACNKAPHTDGLRMRMHLQFCTTYTRVLTPIQLSDQREMSCQACMDLGAGQHPAMCCHMDGTADQPPRKSVQHHGCSRHDRCMQCNAPSPASVRPGWMGGCSLGSRAATTFGLAGVRHCAGTGLASSRSPASSPDIAFPPSELTPAPSESSGCPSAASKQNLQSLHDPSISASIP